jgi:hypothetical protein
MDTKYLRLRTAVELGSRFDDWQVCWLGGWSKDRLYFLVMLVKAPSPTEPSITGPPKKH